jgi:hypothetical protein
VHFKHHRRKKQPAQAQQGAEAQIIQGEERQTKK